MNKKIVSVLISVILITPTSANAAFKNEIIKQPATIAILDTALDTNVATLQGRISYEVCILEWNSCPNGKTFMEGPGSVNLPYHIISKNGFEHGTQMTSIFTSNNKEVNVVFIRIVANSRQGFRQTTNEITFINALDWVYKNKDRFNIQAVSMSQSHHNLIPGTDYCPKTVATQNKIKELVNVGIPVFLPAGNLKDYKHISWPACIDESISVGGATEYYDIPAWSNIDVLKTDFYALGIMEAMSPGTQLKTVIGTSVSTQVAAAQWMAVKKSYPSLSYQQIYDLLSKKSKSISNPKRIFGKMINLQEALNG
jgi:hypothetical protein